MNIQKFTQKSIDAIQRAHSLAKENQNSQIEQEHLLYALLIQDESLINQLLKKMGVSDNFKNELKKEIDNKPKMRVSGHNNINGYNNVGGLNNIGGYNNAGRRSKFK